MERNSIIKILREISQAFISMDKIDLACNEGERRFFGSLISDSSQAINFVILIEDEFEIEFDDDEIDLDFYSGYDRIVELIQNKTNK